MSKTAAAKVDALVIGGGFYGSTIAASAAGHGASVVLLEAGEGLLGRASFANQARVHAGYHYPRSVLTALRSSVNFARFVDAYSDCIDKSFTKLYAIAQGSKVTAAQFKKLCDGIGAPAEPAADEHQALFSRDLIEEVFLTREYAFDAERLRQRALRDLAATEVDVRYGTAAARVEPTGDDRVLVTDSNGAHWNAGAVFACVYAQTNTLLHASELPPLPLKHELAEIPLLRVPAALANLGITIMDGPYFSVMPFPARQAHSIHHVRYSPHCEWFDETRPRDAYEYLRQQNPESHARYMIADARRYVPALRDLEPFECLFEVKTVLRQNEVDDGRPICLRANHGIPNFSVVLGAKIDNIFDALEALDIGMTA